MQIISRSEAKSQGLKFYFTGKPCKSGHVSERYAANCNCRGCKETEEFKASCARYYSSVKDEKKTYNTNYYAENKKEISEAGKKWRAENQQSIIDRRKAYRAKNGEVINQKVREWREKNPDYTPPNSEAYQEKWYEENKARLAPIRKAHFESNRGMYRANRLNRIAREKAAEGRHTARDVEKLLADQQHKCANCQICVKLIGYHVDHIQPLSKGGSNWPSNLQILCATCNLKKSAKCPVEWARKNGRAP